MAAERTTTDCGKTIGRHTNSLCNLDSLPTRQVDLRPVECDRPAGQDAAEMLATAMAQHQTLNPKQRDSTENPVLPLLPSSEAGTGAVSSSEITKSNKPPPAMIFSDFYRASRSPLSKLRLGHHSHLSTQSPSATPEWVSNEYADLHSRDKSKQKEAVKRYLTDKVRNDWSFTWPPMIPELPETADTPEEQVPSNLCGPAATIELGRGEAIMAQNGAAQASTTEEDGYQGDEGTELDGPESVGEEDDAVVDDDAESIYSVVSEDAQHYRPRSEWTSDLSDDEDLPTASTRFRSDHPDATKPALQDVVQVKRAQRRRALREEIAWNEGLACFEARRNAWTGAKTVRVRSKPVTTPSSSPRSPRRLFFRRSMSGSPPTSAGAATAQHGDGSGAVSDSSSLPQDVDRDHSNKHRVTDSSASESIKAKSYPVETLLPIGQPLLPPTNPLRASISPNVYLGLYDKVILHNLQPACPINLSDMLRSCVAGWKRDGEWPPRPTMTERVATRKPPVKKTTTASSTNDNASNVARRMSFGLLGRDKDDESGNGKGIRRSLQKALGIGVIAGISGN